MGGGDLNTKKSWHPNTMKNQERVWKAEQAAAEEKKRILELQREREEERDRTQLKELAQRNFGAHSSSAASDNRLHWMYDKPDKQAQQEDYLLGKAIGKTDEGDHAPQNAIPALSRRVVGSSMMTTGDDTQVDLVRKLREDPLLLVKERERAARAALLNNPLQRKKLTELLRKDQEEKESRTKKKSKKKKKDLDDALAAKLNALAGKKGIDLTSLLNLDDSSDSSSSDEKTKKKKKKRKHEKKKKSKKSKKKQQSSESETESSDDADIRKSKKKSKTKKDKISTKSHKDKKPETRKRRSEDSGSDVETKRKKSHHDQSESESGNYRKKQDLIRENVNIQRNPGKDIDRRDRDHVKDKREKTLDEGDKKDSRQYRESPSRRADPRRVSPESPPRRDSRRRASPSKRSDEVRGSKRQGLTEEEKAARLAEMVAAGAEREVERGHRVARQRAEDAAPAPRAGAAREARALPDSLEDRIRSNRHYIQRDRLHMNEHFARR